MNQSIMKLGAAVLLAAIAVFFIGCEGDGGGDSAPTVDVTGDWLVRPSERIVVTINLIQDGAHVTGTAQGGREVGSVSGFVSGNAFSFTVEWPITGTMTGISTVEGDTMSGSITLDGVTESFTSTRR